MPKVEISRFDKAGFTDRETPDDGSPSIPSKISQVNNVGLGNLMSKYGSWREYAEHQLARATAEAAEKQEAYQFKWDTAYQRCASGTETSKKRILGTDQNLAAVRGNLLEAITYRDMLFARVESYNNAIAIISREITRRGFTIEQK